MTISDPSGSFFCIKKIARSIKGASDVDGQKTSRTSLGMTVYRANVEMSAFCA